MFLEMPFDIRKKPKITPFFQEMGKTRFVIMKRNGMKPNDIITKNIDLATFKVNILPFYCISAHINFIY